MTQKIIYYATGNENKVQEAQLYFNELGNCTVKQYKVARKELQDPDPFNVAKFSAEYILKNDPHVKKPFFVEDAGLFIAALKGFPGVYSAYALQTIGNEGILKLLENNESRDASFRSTIALITKDDEMLTFQGITSGKIAKKKTGEAWGFNPIFIPDESNEQTYAELGEHKTKFSHRIRSLKKMISYIKQNS